MKKVPNPIDVHVGSRIRLRRTMIKMSQEKLSDGLGITFQQIQKYEKGINRVGASRLQQIAEILDIPIPFFFEGGPSAFVDGGMPTSPGINDIMSSRECLAMAVAFNAIEDRVVRRRLLELVQSMAPASAKLSQSDDATIAYNQVL